RGPHLYMRVWASTDFFDGASCREEGRIQIQSAWVRGCPASQPAAASTLHAVGSLRRSRTIMPLARGAAPVRRDPPETRPPLATKDEDGRAPHIAVGAVMPPAATLFFVTPSAPPLL